VRLIFTTASTFGDRDIDYDQYTIPAMWKYAKRCGADFKVIRNCKNPEWGGNPTWYRVDELIKLKSNPKYSHVLYLDCDIFIDPDADSIFEVDGIDECDVAMGIEQWCDGILPQDHIDSILRIYGHKPTYNDYHNAGVLYLTRHAILRLQLTGPYTHSNWFDQDFLNYRIKTSGLNLKTLDTSWNWIPDSDEFHANFYHCAFQHKPWIEKLHQKFNII
jgi:hypothetical protein